MDAATAAAKVIELVTKASSQLNQIISDPELEARVDRIATKLGPYGVDPFGFDPEFLKKVVGLGAWFYRSYFRCECFGSENLPPGRAMLIANHSGQLPFDGAMITVALFLERDPPRYVRSMVERFVPSTPFVSMFLARCGQILGTPENCRRLLAAEEAILAFPEGVTGINKTWKHRYKLQNFGTGFMRLAIENHTPVVPVAVIGAEEQAPSFYNARFIGKLFGMPAFPITPTNPWLPLLGLLPYPTKYRIYFGEPLTFAGDANEEDDVVRQKVETVKSKLQAMLDEGLSKREHVFW